MGAVLILLGWVLLATSSFVWGGHGIYELIKTDKSFLDILLPNFGFLDFTDSGWLCNACSRSCEKCLT